MRVLLSNTTTPSPFGIVDCEESPWNLGLPLRAIMDAQNWILDRLPQDRPLVIIMGENHSYQTHPFLQKKLLEALSEQRTKYPDRSFAFGVELDHNLFNISKECDPHGQASLNAFQKHIMQGSALAARKDLFKTCLNKKISTSFNDIAAVSSEDESLIDQRDLFSAHMVTRYLPDMIGKDIKRSAPIASLSARHGMMLSNQAIVENAIAHMERTQSRIYVQHCGLNHALGKKDTAPEIRKTATTDAFCEFPYQESLSAVFQKRGYNVLPVMMDYHAHDNTVPKDAVSMLLQSVLIQEMDGSPVHRGPYHVIVETIQTYSEFNY